MTHMRKRGPILALVFGVVLLASCMATPRAVLYPPADDFYFTLGDGKIRDYTPVGYVCAHRASLISDPAASMQALVKETIPQKAKEIGGDGVIAATIEVRKKQYLESMLGEKYAITVYIVDMCGQAIRLKRG